MTEPQRQTEERDRPSWLYPAIAFVVLAFGFPLCMRGINLSDEGYMLLQSLDLLHGSVLYRDMDSFVAPGMWFLLAGTFKIFGVSVFVSRMLMLALYVGLGLTAFRIVTPLAGRTYGLITVASLLLFSVWAFPTWTFAFYSPVAILLCLLGLERLLSWKRTERDRDLVLTGLLLGLAICFKQNYGVFATLGAALGYLSMRIEKANSPKEILSGSLRHMGLVSGSMIGAGIPFLIYFVSNGALEQAWFSLVVHPFEFAGRHDIPFAKFSDLWLSDLYNTGESRLTYLSYANLNTVSLSGLQPFRIAERLHLLLYWIAPLIILTGCICAFVRGHQNGRRIDSALFTCALMSGCTFLGVFPRADFNHLVNVYQPIIVMAPLTIWASLSLLSPSKAFLRTTLITLVSTFGVVYGGLAVYWYGGLIERMNTPLSMPRGGVLVNSKQAFQIEQQIRTIKDTTLEDDAVLTVPDLSMLNFLANRKMPSRWYNLYEHHIASDEGQGVVEASKQVNVDLVITRFDNFFSDRVGLIKYAPYLSEYIITHFERDHIGTDENFVVYKARPEPEAETRFINALANCLSENQTAEVRDHLLFSAIYHKSHPSYPIPPQGLKTSCEVTVQKGLDKLSLDIGYRKPFYAERGTLLTVSISINNEGVQENLLSERMRIVPARDSIRQQPFERFHLDLSPWIGQTVTLEFETYLKGTVRSRPGDLKGFAGIYRDVRLQGKKEGARP